MLVCQSKFDQLRNKVETKTEISSIFEDIDFSFWAFAEGPRSAASGSTADGFHRRATALVGPFQHLVGLSKGFTSGSV